MHDLPERLESCMIDPIAALAGGLDQRGVFLT
jgi:hypothetical protein